MKKTKFINRFLSVFLCFSILATCLPISMMAFAAQSEYKGGAGIKVSDLDTSTKYSESLGDNASTEYSGRVWTDKSVYTNSVTFDTYGGGKSTIKLNEAQNGEDFLVAYSALATSESVSGSAQAPVDVVFIIDISGSMSNSDSEMDNGLSRIANTVAAVNSSIEKLMALNEHTRVAVVAFSNTATTLLPLDRYTKMTSQYTTYDYLSLNSQEAGGNVVLYARAVGEENGNINTTRNVTGGTNTQMGIYQGMNILATEASTTADVNGQSIQRIPSVVLLSDGASTYSSGSYGSGWSSYDSNWWAPNNNNNDGPGGSPYYGNGFKALMTGAYMKNAIDKNYNVSGTSYATSFYTVGMGISELSNYQYNWNGSYYTGEQDLAYITLNPKGNWSENNNMVNSVKNAWTNYTNQTPNGNGTITVQTNNGENYTVRHPSSNDIYTANDKTALQSLVDSYYDADNATAVNDVFSQIVSNISISRPEVPTEIKGDDPITSGYITYTDPIGDYMEVKDIKAIIYAGETFTAKTSATNGNVTTYTFTGQVHSAVYGDQNIDDIIITVTTAADGKQTLVVKIPASVIPLRINEVQLNADGTVKTHTNNGAMPARVIYSVGLQDEVVKVSDTGVAYIDKSKISAQYLEKNTNADGTINFYSNVFTGNNVLHDHTVGDATVEFEPSHNNSFYYILEDMPIYTDKEFNNQVRASEGIDDSKIYYYKDVYYHGSAVETAAIERTGAQLNKTTIKTGADGYLYRAADTPRLNRILKFEGKKSLNATNTAVAFYVPEFHYAEGSTSAYDGKFVVYQGNNGRLSLTAGGNLEVRKTVNAGIGLTAPDKEFTFTLDINGSNVSDIILDYVVTKDNATVKTGTLSKNSNTFTLKDGQVATIFSLPPETTYTVTEAATEGFTTKFEGATGTVKANETSVASFTNTYNADPVSFPANDTLKGKKVLEGRKWSANDSFTFFIYPYNAAPLPANYDSNKGITINGPDATDGKEATIDFGAIEFTAPGTYRYTIAEDEPENDKYLPGISYSRALYRIVINVADDGKGKLYIVSYGVQRLYDDDANPLFTYNSNNEIVMNAGQEAQDEVIFTNTYSAESVVRVPVAFKEYTDNSGVKPLVSGMFEFKLEALGVVENGAVVPNSASRVPMPENKLGGSVTTSNEGHNVTFPSVTFTQDVIPQNATSITFRYQMSEVIPTNKVNGMSYDDSAYNIDVVVSIDPTSHILNVEAIYPNNERIAVFKNEYTQSPVTADINGNKTLNGRDMKPGEQFEFGIIGANAATNNAIRNQTVVIPDNTATVMNAKNGVASAFAFEDVTFKKEGTYVFAVSEIIGNDRAVKYDYSVVNVTVVVDDANDDGKLEITSINYDNGKAQAEFVNNYEAIFTGPAVNLAGTKRLTGKSLLAGEFYFVVEESFNNQKVREGVVTHAVAENAVGGVYSGAISILKDVTYDKAGEYTYLISEQIPDQKVEGTVYDQSKYRYTVIVTDDLSGKLEVTSTSLQKLNNSVWDDADAVVFTNTYTPKEASANLPLIKKVVSGSNNNAFFAGKFSFTLAADPSNPEGMQLPSNTTVTNAANGDIAFGAIKFTKAGTFKVIIKENVPSDANKLAGITYSTQEIVATYHVTDDRIGSLTATLVDYSGDSIVNTFKADAAEVTIDITKNFTGRDWISTDKFDFEVVVLDPNTAEAIESGKIEFPLDNATSGIVKKTIDHVTPNKTISGTVKVNAPGTYKFIVREITGNISGVHYDSLPREITIVATENTATAKIETVVLVNGQPTNNLTLTFDNVYDASSTEISGHDHLTIEKVFTGRENDKWLDTDAFTFTIEPHNDAAKASVAKGTNGIEMPANTITITNANKAHPHFGNIIFHETGYFEFKVTEVGQDSNGIDYDNDNDRIVKINVADNGLGALVATLANDSEELKFTNTYSAQSVVLEGAAKLAISKQLTGRKWLADDEFKFKLEAFGDSTKAAVTNSDVVLTNSEITIKSPSNGHSGNVAANFGNITFKKAGVYHFLITEVEGNDDNIEYSPNFYEVVVTVTDNNSGKLVATTEYYGSSVFENVFTPDAIAQEIKGEKLLEGNRALAADEFEFVLTAVTQNAPMPAKRAVKNQADGTINFGRIEFTKAGTYVYEINETKANIPGVTYDTNKVTATVTVTYDDATGKLSANTVYAKAGEQGTKSEFTFKNIYKADDSEPISIGATKKVTASSGNSFEMNGGEFKFIIEGTQGTPMPAVTNPSNDKNGNVSFGTVKFTKAGTYKYTVRELQEDRGGITYDGEVYTITVEVTDNVRKAKLEAGVTITNKAGQQVNEIIFDNKYNPKETSAVIFGSKELTGGHKQLTADEFEFTISAVTQNAPMPNETTVKNTDTGIFQFDSITYTKVGTYEYEITENNLGKDGYTYDDSKFTVTVTVKDDNNGKLSAEVQGLGTATAPEIKFVNSYEPQKAKVVLGQNGELSKALIGRELKADEFVFAILDSEKKEIATAKNDKDGKLEFTLEFAKAGTYSYTIVEKNNAVANVTYDDKAYNVEIVIVDENAALKAQSVKYSYQKDEVEKVVFTNTYTEPTPPTNLPDSPKTGDNSNLILWLALLFVSGGGLALLSKKRKAKEN